MILFALPLLGFDWRKYVVYVSSSPGKVYSTYGLRDMVVPSLTKCGLNLWYQAEIYFVKKLACGLNLWYQAEIYFVKKLACGLNLWYQAEIYFVKKLACGLNLWYQAEIYFIK